MQDHHEAPELQRRTRNRLLSVVAVLLSLAALHFGRPVFLPFIAGLLIASLAWPVHPWLAARIPRGAALLATILVIVSVFTALLGAVAWSAARVATSVQEHPERIDSLHRRASAAVSGFGMTLPARGGDAGSSAGGSAPRGEPGQSSFGTDLAKRLGVGVYSVLGSLALAVGFAALTLAELRTARDRIRLRFGADDAARLLGISSEIAGSMRRYVRVKSITSAIAGIASGVLSLIFGLEFALVWAFLAFLFEYVPTIGSILAVVPPVAYAFLQFDDFTRPLVAMGVFTVVQLFLGNYVDPRIEGRLLSISPLVVLLAIVFWAFLWGAPGSLLGVPIVVAITVVTRHFESTRWVWALLTEPNDEEKEGAR